MGALMIVQGLRRSWRVLGRFGRARRGAVALEFSLVGLPFFMLLISIFVLGFMMFCSSTLDYATQKGVRQLIVGAATNANLSADQFRTTVICPLLPAAAFDCSKVVVNLTTVPLLADNHGDPNAFNRFVKSDQSGLIIPSSQSTFCTGTTNKYEVLEIVYPMPLYLSIFSTAPQVVNGNFMLMSSAAFKNEPYQGSNSSTGC